jgi:four helix bundle protein
MGTVKTHRDLIVWQEAMRLAEMVFRETENLPKEEIYGLAAQMRRSAVSVPANIAEGAARNSPRELLQYLGIATGSLAELETQLELVNRLGLGKVVPACRNQVSRVGRLLVGIRHACRLRVD